MKVILGTYRGPFLVTRALASLQAHLTGWDSLTIIDDSGNSEWVDFYERILVEFPGGKSFRPKVVAFPQKGYNVAMREVCRQARDERFMFWEEDFVLKVPVDLRELEVILDERPGLAQVALLRGPHFPIEHQFGGLLEGLQARRPHAEIVHEADGLIVQKEIFTCNPAVWQEGIAARGWPLGKWSEDAFTRELQSAGYAFAYLPGVRVTHDGERSGFGY